VQAVNNKVFYTGGKAKDGHTEPTRIKGNIMYCTGRPDMCQEIEKVILKKHSRRWLATPSTSTGKESNNMIASM
jgi:hypothetical protein